MSAVRHQAARHDLDLQQSRPPKSQRDPRRGASLGTGGHGQEQGQHGAQRSCEGYDRGLCPNQGAHTHCVRKMMTAKRRGAWLKRSSLTVMGSVHGFGCCLLRLGRCAGDGCASAYGRRRPHRCPSHLSPHSVGQSHRPAPLRHPLRGGPRWVLLLMRTVERWRQVRRYERQGRDVLLLKRMAERLTSAGDRTWSMECVRVHATRPSCAMVGPLRRGR